MRDELGGQSVVGDILKGKREINSRQAKALADQATAAVPTFIGNYLVLGALPQAATLLGIQTAVDFVHDYSIELAWNVWGPQRLREAPTIDFPGAGEIPGAD